MSKSLNNSSLQEISFLITALRLFVSSFLHYHSPIDFNKEIIEESERAVNNFYSALKSVNYLV